MPTAEELAAALGALRVSPPADWEDVRSAYRDGLMATHPDTAGTADSDGRTAGIVDAFRLLRTATQDGLLPLADVMANAAAVAAVAAVTAAASPPAGNPLLPAVVLEAAAGDVFSRVREALATEGEISGIDPSAGLIQAVVNAEGFAASQLTAEVMPTGDGDAQVLFTLEPLGVGSAPPIESIVERLGAHLRLVTRPPT